MNDLTTSQRIEYIDSLKGFLILSVVMCHVAGLCFGIQADIPSFQHILFEFRNPPFFFISGFLAYKIATNWNVHTVTALIRKKFISILWPTIIFTLAFKLSGNTLCDSNSTNIWFYWFTISLFVFFLYYYILEFCLHFLNNEIIKSLLFLIICIFFYFAFSIQSIYEKLPIDDATKDYCGMKYWGYFFFFILGILARKHDKLFNQLLDNIFFTAACVFIFILFNFFSQPLQENHFNLFRITTYLTGTILVILFFKKHIPTGKYKSILNQMGKRTLDIYLIHTFLLPLSFYDYTTFLRVSPMPIVEFIITFSMSIIIIGMSFIISCFLRLSPISALILFGDRTILKQNKTA